MRFRVLKQFRGLGESFERGAEIDLESTVKVQALISQRYLLPIDPAVAAAVESPVAAIEDTKARKGRASKSTSPNSGV